MRLFEIVFAICFIIPVVIAVGTFAGLSAGAVMIVFAPFWVLSAVINILRGRQ